MKKQDKPSNLSRIFEILRLMQIEEAGIAFFNIEDEEHTIYKVKYNKKIIFL